MTDTNSATRPLPAVQAVRALAATLVLVGHTLSNVSRAAVATGASAPAVIHLPGGFWVDLLYWLATFAYIRRSQRGRLVAA